MKKLDAKSVKACFEWAELVNSFRGYIEDGQMDYTVEGVRDFTPEQVALLTPKRIELLYQLASFRVESINDLARKIRRDAKNVYQDLQVLGRIGIVKLEKQKGRAIIPETPVKEVTFLIR